MEICLKESFEVGNVLDCYRDVNSASESFKISDIPFEQGLLNDFRKSLPKESKSKGGIYKLNSSIVSHKSELIEKMDIGGSLSASVDGGILKADASMSYCKQQETQMNEDSICLVIAAERLGATTINDDYNTILKLRKDVKDQITTNELTADDFARKHGTHLIIGHISGGKVNYNLYINSVASKEKSTETTKATVTATLKVFGFSCSTSKTVSESHSTQSQTASVTTDFNQCYFPTKLKDTQHAKDIEKLFKLDDIGNQGKLADKMFTLLHELLCGSDSDISSNSNSNSNSSDNICKAVIIPLSSIKCVADAFLEQEMNSIDSRGKNIQNQSKKDEKLFHRLK